MNVLHRLFVNRFFLVKRITNKIHFFIYILLLQFAVINDLLKVFFLSICSNYVPVNYFVHDSGYVLPNNSVIRQLINKKHSLEGQHALLLLLYQITADKKILKCKISKSLSLYFWNFLRLFFFITNFYKPVNH